MSQFESIEDVAKHLRQDLESKKTILLFAYNGTGKTRLSMAFKELGKQDGERDTLYFNAFTEDLFSWDNDLDGDSERMLRLNSSSKFFAGLEELEMDNRIRPFLNRYADFDFRIDTDNWVVRFSREVYTEDTSETFDDIKVSRGEENLFIWCFFLAVVELAMDKGIEAYSWVKYVYIDDPISSLDENNAIAVGHHLAQLLKKEQQSLKTIISSHHPLFFNVLCNEFRNQMNKKRNKSAEKYFLSNCKKTNSYELIVTSDTPSFYHVAMIKKLHEAVEQDRLFTYHFAILRSILEKTASFLGYEDFSKCIRLIDDEDDRLLMRAIQIFNHSGYSHYEPVDMVPDNKELFEKIFYGLIKGFNFNEALFPAADNAKRDEAVA